MTADSRRETCASAKRAEGSQRTFSTLESAAINKKNDDVISSTRPRADCLRIRENCV